MVYEDALTILSYASPYPVNICLQKQDQLPKSRRISDARTSLNHPLYRSQSVDALHGIGKDPIFHPKRSLSEMRSDKRDSPKIKHVSRPSLEKDISEEISQSPMKSEQKLQKVSPVATAEVTVHRDDSRSDIKKELIFDKQFSVDSGVPNATVDLNHVGENKADSRLANVKQEGVDELDNSAQISKDQIPIQTDFADIFDKLTEEDKLDVIRLSYEDSFTESSNIMKDHVVEAELTPSASNGELKSAPVKPERKKKRSSSSSSLDGESPLSPRSTNIEDDDVVESILQPPTEAPPPVPEDELEFEADEDIITPQSKTRVISVNTDKIVFEQMTPAKLDISNASFDKAFNGHDNSFSDEDKILTNSSELVKRPPSPDGEPVTEDEIAPMIRLREDLEILPLNLKSEENVDSAVQKKDGKMTESDSNLEEFEKDFPKLDMNLNFESDSVIFKENFPSRNTKEKDGGMSYDISVTELEAMENKMKEEIAKQNDNQRKSGGVAFEVRDDYVTGVQQTVTTKSVQRTSSYELGRKTGSPVERLINNDRPTSMKLDFNKSDEFDGNLDWSGKRLIRSGSFTEIPQDDFVKNWTDNQNLADDDASVEKHIKEDSGSTNLKKLTKATAYKAKTNLDNSDSDSRCHSLSSSSRDSSPERVSYDVTNGPDDGLGSSPDTETLKINPELKKELKSPVPLYSENGQSVTVTLNTGMENDADC